VSPRRVELVKNVSLSVVSTVLMLFLIEMLLRVTEVVPVRTLEYATPDMWAVNPGPLLPGQSYTDRFKSGLAYRVSTNNLGFRGSDVALHKAAGVLRVLCLGDSYTFGAYVDDMETWPAQLELALKEGMPGREVEVINAGISGFTIVDELSFLEEQGLRLEPDVVVVGFVLNDLADLTRRVSSREMLKRASEEAASPLGSVKLRLRQTAIYNALFLAKAYVRKATGSDPTLQEVDIRHLLKTKYDQQTLDLFDQYRSHLARMSGLLKEKGVPLVLLIFPYWEQVSQAATDQAQKRMLAMAGDLGIPALDLLPAFKKYDPRGKNFFHMPRDHHPSKHGYHRTALELAPLVQSLLGRTPRPVATAVPPPHGDPAPSGPAASSSRP
jgi:lysophospholipase L1-like esterase